MPAPKRSDPLLWVIAGPNGSGKSTYYQAFVAHHLNAPCVNADEMALAWFGRHPRSDAETARAARLAAKRRLELLNQRQSFVMETVFSHPSKLEIMQTARSIGYRIRLSVICTANPYLNVARVEDRVVEGGHIVPTDRILSRYERALPLLAEACLVADWAVVLDNSFASTPFQRLLIYEAGAITEQADELPAWVDAFVATAPVL